MTNVPSDQISGARTLLEEAKSILIAVGNNPNLDSLAAGLSLYIALTSAGKQVSIVSPTPATVLYNHLIAIDKVSTSIGGSGGRNLVISFPYQEGSIEKVSYNIENETFNLVIEPREGYPIVTANMMKYSYGGGSTDVIITIGTATLASLQNIYTANQALFAEKPVINIDTASGNANFGRVNIIDTNLASISELIVSILTMLGINIDADIATNLLVGITSASNNFSSAATTAATFETAALLLKQGARKSPAPQISGNEIPQAFPTFGKGLKQPSTPFKPKTTSPFGGFKAKPSSVAPPVKQQGQTFSASHKDVTHPETPPDWLKPKIYKGSTLL